MSEINNLPKGWEVKKLGEVGQILSGGTPSTQIDEYWNGNIPWISPADLSGYNGKFISKGRKSITEIGLKNSSARLLTKGSVLFSSRAPIGYTVIAANEVSTNQGFKSIVPNDSINNEYLFYYLKASKQMAEKVANGTTFKEISLKAFSQLTIPLPPLHEQLAIVAKIETLFSELDNGIQQLRTAQAQLKVYRQSLLKWAFEGKLTNKDVKEGVLPKGWKKVKLGEIANAVDPQPSHRTPPIVSNGIPYVSIKDFDSQLDKIDLTKARKVSPDVLAEHLNRYTLQNGDFVIGKIGTIGKPVRIVMPQTYSLSANIVLIQPRQINPTYLYYFFQSNQIEKAFNAGMNATTQAAFGIQKVRELQIDLPDEQQQQLIVAELESKLTVCDKIEETINQSLQQAETLWQSILKQAFEGKLVNMK